ncbi:MULTISPECIES: hypothetical protein [unclassified Janthinobacterium]|uniref:hypothetical protein n=1 Tax=unclassified Janthinobacterium TaxID=2610881 RepID=UPI001113E7F0|nr:MULTISPECIES: hypothetical protein [unclassified Janthinobacterium]
MKKPGKRPGFFVLKVNSLSALSHQRLRGGGKSVHTPASARWCQPADRVAQARMRVAAVANKKTRNRLRVLDATA